jgi:hypothetical protein
MDTSTVSAAWFGAVSEVVTRWVLAEQPHPLGEAYPTLSAVLLRGVQSAGEPINGSH